MSDTSFRGYYSLGANGAYAKGHLQPGGMPGKLERCIIDGQPMIMANVTATDLKTSGSIRSEVQRNRVDAPLQETVYHAFGFYVMPDWYVDPNTKPVIFQLHQTPDVTDSKTNSPPFEVVIQGNNIVFYTRYSADAINLVNGTTTKIASIPWQYSRLLNFELIAKWSWLSDGYIKIMHNGLVLAEHKGPNCYNDTNGLYAKTGIYHWQPFPAAAQSRTIYVKDIVTARL